MVMEYGEQIARISPTLEGADANALDAVEKHIEELKRAQKNCQM